MVGLFVFAFAQLSRFPDAKRGARFRVYFEYRKTKAERKRHAMNSTTAPVWCKVPKFEITKDSKLDIPVLPFFNQQEKGSASLRIFPRP